jgi:hypothetical protein
MFKSINPFEMGIAGLSNCELETVIQGLRNGDKAVVKDAEGHSMIISVEEIDPKRVSELWERTA